MGVIVAEVVDPTITPIINQSYVVVSGPVAQPIVTAAPVADTWMKMNPYFDWSPFLGIPFWVLVAAFLFLVLIIVNAYWLFRIRKLAAVKGYVIAVKAATQEDVMTWIISTTKNLTIECLKKRDSVLSFYDPINITKWVHTAREAVIHIGGKGGVIVSEDYFKTRDIVSEIALCVAAEEFNNNQESLLKEYGAESIRPIKNYDDYECYGRSVLEALHPEGLKVPSYWIFDPDKFKKYFPPGLTATFHGGIIIRDARSLNLGNNKQSFWEKMLPFGILCGISMLFVLAAWMVPLGR